jgi:tripartite-type tricarboxylate transporter receptor subunit TctC
MRPIADSTGVRMGRIWAAVIAVALAGVSVEAAATDYPTRHVRIITAGAGTFHDIVARQLGQRLSERWGHGVVVENQPAAGLTIGAAIAARAAPDGYTLLLADRTSLAVAPHLYRSLRYDPVKDFRPVTLVARAPSVLVVHSSVPAGNLREFIDYARRQPDPLLFASAGPGTLAHLTGELFRQLAAVDFQTIQYRGGADAAMAVLKGEARFSTLPISTVLPHVEAGKMKALAVASTRRFAGMPAVPTAAEAGLPGFESEQWVGMLVPAGTPDAIVHKLNRDIVETLSDPAVSERLGRQGSEVAPGTPADFATFVASESARMRKLVEAAGVRLD